MKEMLTFLKDEDGQGMVEYGLIIGLISVAVIAVLVAMGPKLKNLFSSASDALDNATT